MRSARWLLGLLSLLIYGIAVSSRADAAGNAASDAGTIPLAVAATTDISEASDLIADFMKRNPDVVVRYSKMVSGDLFRRIVHPATPEESVDVAWSSAMDLQVKLANDGFAKEYHSAESAALPAWAQWKGLVYGVTAEPVVFVFNKRLLRDGMVPRDHAGLLRLLGEHPETFHGRIATYDPELSGTGLLLLTQDVRVTPETWKLAAALGRADVKLYTLSGPMIDRVAAGELLLAYDVPGSYALEHAKNNNDLGIVYPADYTLVLSRAVLIPRSARHPQVAERFVDFILSRAGQGLLVQHSLGSVRTDMTLAFPGLDSGKAFRPIGLGIDLMTYLDQAKRRRFLKEWKASLQK